jgi:hypothetical protein
MGAALLLGPGAAKLLEKWIGRKWRGSVDWHKIRSKGGTRSSVPRHQSLPSIAVETNIRRFSSGSRVNHPASDPL